MLIRQRRVLPDTSDRHAGPVRLMQCVCVCDSSGWSLYNWRQAGRQTVTQIRFEVPRGHTIQLFCSLLLSELKLKYFTCILSIFLTVTAWMRCWVSKQRLQQGHKEERLLQFYWSMTNITRHYIELTVKDQLFSGNRYIVCLRCEGWYSLMGLRHISS